MLIDIPTEQTTAATDLVLAAVACLCARSVVRWAFDDPLRKAIWAGVFVLAAVAGALGAAVHGLEMSQGLNFMLWQPLNLALAMAVALFAAAGAWDLGGRAPALRTLAAAGTAGAVFFALSWVHPETFLPFVVYQGAALFFVMVVYLYLAARMDRAGAGLLACGVGLTILASVVQTREAIRFVMIWEFDSNGVFHLLQVPALLLVRAGVKKMAERRDGDPEKGKQQSGGGAKGN